MRRFSVSLALSLASLSSTVQAATSVDFPFDDERYLLFAQQDGGRAFVPEGVVADQPVPLVIFLHGTNDMGPLHRWMAEPNDLRPVVQKWVRDGAVGPMVLAAPSQTRKAWSGKYLWAGFDAGAFVAATQSALGASARLDRNQVVLVGHSGAGCNDAGGLLAAAGSALLFKALVAIDTCMDGGIGEQLGQAASALQLRVYWQPESWRRDVAAFEQGLLSAAGQASEPPVLESIPGLGLDAHNLIVREALRRALPQLVPPAARLP
jgi:hypothetical protein